VLCHLRGKKSELVVGDRVRWQPRTNGRRRRHRAGRAARNLLFRQDEWRTKSFAANLDQLLVMVAVRAPVFSESQLTRALIAAQRPAFPCCIG
jgi:ribosome biogenesis GTPase